MNVRNGRLARIVAAVALLLLIWLDAADCRTVTLAWDANREPDIAGYVVFYGTSSQEYFAAVDVGNQLSAQFTDLDATRTYYFAVQAYNTAGLRSPLSAEVFATPALSPLTLTSLTADRASPQPAATQITFVASATGGVSPYEYKWLVSDGVTSTSGQEWSTSSTFAWTPMQPNTDYRIVVWARSATSTVDAFDNLAASGAMAFAITESLGSNVVASVIANKDAPQPAGSKILFTANARGGTSPYQYKWLVASGGDWAVEQDWSTNNKFSWQPMVANAEYNVRVRVRDATASDDRSDAETTLPFSITVSKRGGQSH